MHTRICPVSFHQLFHKLYPISGCPLVIERCRMPEILLHQSLRMMLNVRPIPSSIEYFIFQPKVCNLCPSIKATVAVEYPLSPRNRGVQNGHSHHTLKLPRKPNPLTGNRK